MDFRAVNDLQSQKLVQYSKEVLWLGFSWTCKRRKHYRSFCRNGVTISLTTLLSCSFFGLLCHIALKSSPVHNFVYVLADEDKRLVAYLEDLYEDSRGINMVVVRWFHKIDKVDIDLDHNYNCREIFLSHCLQDISIECIDGLATVFSPVHFKNFLNEAKHSLLEPFVCCKQFENDDIKPFDVTQLKGYWKQGILRNMYRLSPLNDFATHQHRADDQKTVWDVDDGVGVRPSKRYCQSKDDDADVLHLHFSGSRESMEILRADLQDIQNSKKGNESFSFQVDEVKQYSSQHLIVGSQVEVLAQDSGMRGCWFRARIIKKRKNKVKVQYQDIQDAVDEANKLEEWILASKVAAPDEVGVRISGRTIIRPPSQFTKGRASRIGVGSVVDVWWHDGWWEGLVQKDSEDKFRVHFPGEKRESVFDIGDIRQSQEWVGNRWTNTKERCDLVSTVLQVGKQDASNSYDFSFDKNTICDGGPSGKDATDCNDSPSEPGNGSAKDERLFPDLSKDDWLSQLKWKSSGKRKRATSTHVRKLNCSRNLNKGTARAVSSKRILIPASLKVDNDNCKYIGDPLFSSSVVPPLTSMVMTR